VLIWASDGKPNDKNACEGRQLPARVFGAQQHALLCSGVLLERASSG